jgi:hypothetical protein
MKSEKALLADVCAGLRCGSVAEVANATSGERIVWYYATARGFAAALHAHRPDLNLTQWNRVLLFRMKSC